MNTFLEDPYVASNPESLAFWEAAEDGRLLGKACGDCGKFHWYPRAICPFCGSLNTDWVPLTGRGHVYAFSTLRRACPPYTVAYVQLAEGPVMLTNLIDIAQADLSIGMPVKVAFRRAEEGRNAPKFTAADNEST